MIRKCSREDFGVILAIINNAAQVYQGFVPEEYWHEPYMTFEEMQQEIGKGIIFWGFEEEKQLIGVMGIQPLQDVTLIRHAYVRRDKQNQGIGGKLLTRLLKMTTAPVLIGTWAAAFWAIRFYQKQGFCLIPEEDREQLLYKYWTISEWQMKMSVVLADYKFPAMINESKSAGGWQR